MFSVGPLMSDHARSRFYDDHAAGLKRALAEELPREDLKALHRKSPLKHFAVAAWQFALLGAASVLLWRYDNPWVWLPAAAVQGLTVFNFTVMLHEVVHRSVFRGRRERLYALLGMLYALPTGISPSQFTRWHLDHHAGLGSDEEDPKRHRLSPKRNARWLKLLYFTPALFLIYFRAAAKETATYPLPLRRRIALERAAGIAVHIGIVLFLLSAGGPSVLARVYLVPVFLVFPAAFALNRLGQHYAIDPGEVAAWSTRMRRSRFWEAAFLFSHYHLEHHDFPGVPFYRLRKLNRLLAPFLDRRGIPQRSFPQLLYLYLVRNRAPHTDWELS
jgi:fatty acid desaturase